VTILFHTHLAHEFPDLIRDLAERHPQHHLVVAEDERDFTERLAGADGVVTGPLAEETLEKAERLKIHFVPFAGVNRAPLRYLASRGIMLSNSHGNAPLVAERAVALAMAAAGRVAEFDRDLRNGEWHRRDDPRQPFDYWFSLRGVSVAVLGTGAIGREIARLMRPLAGRTTGLRRSGGAGHSAGGPRGAGAVHGTGRNDWPHDEPFDLVTDDLNAALDEADLLFVSLPLTPHTNGLIGTAEISRLTGGILVNVSRGEIVQEEPLYRALRSGTLRAAGLDVWWQNPQGFTETTMPSALPFHELSNVVMSPHAGSHAVEGKRLQLEGTIASIDAFLRTGTPRALVDLGAGY
jgi:phosphoglycerate dehydrogenase-like enzyme